MPVLSESFCGGIGRLNCSVPDFVLHGRPAFFWVFEVGFSTCLDLVVVLVVVVDAFTLLGGGSVVVPAAILARVVLVPTGFLPADDLETEAWRFVVSVLRGEAAFAVAGLRSRLAGVATPCASTNPQGTVIEVI